MEKFANKTNLRRSEIGRLEAWIYPSLRRMNVNKVVVAKCRPVNVVAKLKPYRTIRALLTMIIPTDVTTLNNHEAVSSVAFLSALLAEDIFFF
jgi:hypothetical protein